MAFQSQRFSEQAGVERFYKYYFPTGPLEFIRRLATKEIWRAVPARPLYAPLQPKRAKREQSTKQETKESKECILRFR